MPPNIKDAVAWLYANVQEEDIITIKLRGAGGTMHYRDGHILAAYLVAQFRIADNETLMENTAKNMPHARPLNAYDVAFLSWKHF